MDKNKLDWIQNDQSAPSESSERGCTAAKPHATGTGMDFAYCDDCGPDWAHWWWSLRSSETTTRSPK